MASYDVEHQIGKGAFGEVYFVGSKTTGERYILKKISISSEKQLERAYREVLLLKTMDHPNIVRYNNAKTESTAGGGTVSKVLIEMEYCENGDLARAIANQNGVSFSDDRVFSWFAHLCSAISYIHNNGIMHRDLKPQNIFLKADNTIKIGDFGIAAILENTFAQAETMCGTFGYIAPEILNNTPYGKECDIWSLGCIFFEIGTLESAFPKDLIGLVRNMDQISTTVLSKCPRPIDQLVGIMLKYNPSERACIRTVSNKLAEIRQQQADGSTETSEGMSANCDNCGSDIRKIRYKCIECRDYDLCVACEKQGRHSEHKMLRICVKSLQTPIHMDITCDACATKPIHGLRYMCLSCNDYNLCSHCFSLNKHPEHKFAIVC